LFVIASNKFGACQTDFFDRGATAAPFTQINVPPRLTHSFKLFKIGRNGSTPVWKN
jgi:hypothetical protein